MSRASRAWWLAAGLLALPAVACGMANSADFSNGSDSPGADAGLGNPSPNSDGGSAGQRATGIILVHAASFPSFRLCFSNHPELRPQPDSRIMPEANVVGVEIGSLVRLDPLTAPGTVYVIPEENIRAAPGATTPTCGDLVGKGDAGTKKPELDLNFDYQVAAQRVTDSLGHGGVSVLAITGCGGGAYLELIGASSANCGASWNETHGNLEALTYDLPLTGRSGDYELPVRLFQMSHELAALDADAGSLAVSFGGLEDDAGPLAQSIPVAPLYEPGTPTSLTFDQSTSGVFASTGFRIRAGGGFSVDQSLASVQELSSSPDLPTQYYRVASNYALLLVGDPAHKPTLPGGDPNPSYNPRRAVHLLAVPVVDPNPRDAGTGNEDAGSSDDAGDGG